MKFTRQDVELAAALSRLEIKSDRLDRYQSTLNNIVEYMRRLAEADTRETEPITHVLPLKNVTRPDEKEPSMPRKIALANSPEQEDGYFKVAKIMES